MTTEVDAGYLALIASSRVSARTRTALLDRGAPDDPAYRPAVLTQAEFVTLRAVLGRVLPQYGTPIDLAARMDAALAAGTGDGWRYADLPTDAIAWRTGLAGLDALSGETVFTALDAGSQDALLSRVAAGEAAPGGGVGIGWTGQQMQRWFEDVRGEATKLYVAHPATLARIGYSGIGYGGDGDDKPGFSALEPGKREAWEPLPARGAAP